jgi:hypothetical protein
MLALMPAARGDDTAPPLPEGVQGYSLLGDPLVAAAPDQATLDKLTAASLDYEAVPRDADRLIRYGMRTAFIGRLSQVDRHLLGRHPEAFAGCAHVPPSRSPQFLCVNWNVRFPTSSELRGSSKG